MNGFDFALKILEIVTWPIIVLIVLYNFKKEFSGIFNRAKKVELPGGISIETFQEKLEQAKNLAATVATDGPTGKSFSLDDIEEPKPSDPKLQAIKIRLDLDKKLRKKAEKEGLAGVKELKIKALLNTLLNEKKISEKDYMMSNTLVELTDGVMAGVPIDQEQVKVIDNVNSKISI